MSVKNFFLALSQPGKIALLATGLYLALLIFMLGYVANTQTQFSNYDMEFFLFIHPGAKWDPNMERPLNTEYIGYDGQFFYDLSRNPFHPDTVLDKPAYRTARILYPLVARTLALNQPLLIPITMLLINLVAIAGGSYLLASLLSGLKRAPLWSICYILWPGTICAYLYDLSEPLCFFFIIAALRLHFNRPSAICRISGLLLLASLTKELGLLFGFGFMLYYIVQSRWYNLGILALNWLAPFLIWQIALEFHFGKSGLGAGEPFSPLPLGGFIEAGHYQPPLIERAAIGLAVILPLLWTIYLLWQTWQDMINSVLFYVLLSQVFFLLFLPAATYIYLVDLARNATGLILVLLLLPGFKFARLRVYLLSISLVLSCLIIITFALSTNAFL